ncbi:MAG: peptidase M3, partial [Bacteroidales bacterium]
MKKILFVLLILSIMITSCGKKENPFYSEYDTAFGVPPFDEIKNEHFEPAFVKGMEEQNEEIEAIINNSEEPTFANTIEAIEYSGSLLDKVSGVFYNFNSCLIDDEISEIAKNMAPKMSAHSDNIWLNTDLFERVKKVHDKKDELDLGQEEMMLLTETHKRFVRNGAALPEEKRERLKEINSKLSSLTLEFGQNVMKEVNSYTLVIDNEEDLSGLSKSVINNAAEKAKEEELEGKWVFTLQNPSVMPFLHKADNRELRKKMQQAYINRGNNDNEFDNKKIIGEIVS